MISSIKETFLDISLLSEKSNIDWTQISKECDENCFLCFKLSDKECYICKNDYVKSSTEKSKCITESITEEKLSSKTLNEQIFSTIINNENINEQLTTNEQNNDSIETEITTNHQTFNIIETEKKTEFKTNEQTPIIHITVKNTEIISNGYNIEEILNNIYINEKITIEKYELIKESLLSNKNNTEENIIITTETLVIQLSSLDKQKNSDNSNISSIDIGECENILRTTYNISEDELNKVQQDILDEWAEINRISCERGTKIHAQLENGFYKAGSNITLKKFGIGGKFECKKNYSELDLEYGVYPEYLIYYDNPKIDLHIAGQIDLLIKNGNDIILGDWKTNAKIDQKGFFNNSTKSTRKMKYPLTNIEDCNLWHYYLQLSTYAWMLQKINPDFVIKRLFIYHFDHDGNETLYEVPYLKDDVEKMLKHFVKQQKLEKQKAKYERIEY